MCRLASPWLLGVTVVTLLSVAFVAGPAHAQESDDRFAVIDLTLHRQPGGTNLVPVEVSVLSTRAIEGTLVVEGQVSRIDWELPLALAANSEIRQLILAPVSSGNLDLKATLVVDGEVVAERRLRGFDARASENAVGLIGLAAPAPTIRLTPDVGQASLLELNDLEALAALDSVVASPGGIRTLSDEERTRLLSWTASGRQLIVAGPVGSIDEQLPIEWRSERTVLPAGTGLIRYVGGDWGEAVAPGPRSVANPLSLIGFGTISNNELLNDAGFRLPGLGKLALLLVAYLVLAGPVTFGVLRAVGQLTRAWTVIPVLSVVFTAGVFIAGGALTSGRGNGYAMIAELSPAGAGITQSIVVADDGRQQVALPVGWGLVTSGLVATQNGPLGAPVVVRPSRVGTDLVFDIDPGSGGTALIAGAADVLAGALQITDVQVGNRSVTGVVRNASGSELTGLLVMVGDHLTEVGTLSDGEGAQFTIDLSQRARRRVPELRAWDAEGWFGFDGAHRNDPGVTDGPINASAWLDWRGGRIGTAVPNGVVTAVGWSRDLDPPVFGGRGRTALVARHPVQEATGPPAPALVRSVASGTRGWSEFDFDTDPQQATFVNQFIRPAGASTDHLALSVGRSVQEVQVWTADGWRSIDVVEPGQLELGIPDEAWIADVLWVREWQGPFFAEPSAIDPVFVERSEQTIDAALLGPGERVERFVEPGSDDPFGPRIPVGAENEVVIDASGAFVADGEVFGTYDIWRIELGDGQAVTVAMDAFDQGPLDPYLVVRGPDGGVIAENDDFRGLNSQVDFVAPVDGTYVIEARPLAGEAGFGSYTISVFTDPPPQASTSTGAP